MSLEIKNAIHAIGALHVAGGVPSWTFSRGFSAVIGDTGAGDFLLTYDQPIDIAESIVLLTPLLATAAVATFVRTSDTQLQILTWNSAAGALDNVDVQIAVVRV